MLARKPDYLELLRRLRSLANDGSPLLTMHERNAVLGWPRTGVKTKTDRLWRLVQERMD